jgi:hypothetical protein
MGAMGAGLVRNLSFTWSSLTVIALLASSAPVFAQASDRQVELGGHIATLRLSEFDVTDAGVGVTAAFRLSPIVALDGAVTFFPGNNGGAHVRIARQERVMGLVGARSAIRRGNVELFGRARAGVLRFSSIEGAACIAITIVPLPLECQIATGYTAFATDLGGGIGIDIATSGQLRIEAGDLMVRYGHEAYRSSMELSDGFISHNLQVSAGLMWRF